VLVGGLANMIFEYSKADAIPGAMALRTFTDRLIVAIAALNDEHVRKTIGGRVVHGFTGVADPALATREFAPRVQIVGALKNRECTRVVVAGFELTPLDPPGYSRSDRGCLWPGKCRGSKCRRFVVFQVYMNIHSRVVMWRH